MTAKKFLTFDQFVNEKYNYLGEADGDAAVAAPGSPLTVNLSNDFPSGKWKPSPQVSQSLQAQFAKVEDYIKAHGNTPTTITIRSGESQVPNYDAEGQIGPDGKYPKLQPGELATKRAQSVKALIDQFIASLQSKGINASNIKVDVAQPVIGTTPWKPGDNAADPNYTKEQFVTLEVNAAAPQGAANPLSSFAIRGEIIYDPQKRAFGTLHYKASAQGSGVSAQNEPSILRLCNGNTGQYLNQYVDIPAGKAQEYFGTTNTVQSDALVSQLKSQAKPVPQNDPLYGKNINAARQ